MKRILVIILVLGAFGLSAFGLMQTYTACQPGKPQPKLVGSCHLGSADLQHTVSVFIYIRFLGGDGSSFENAVIITGAHNEMDIVLSEFGWLKSNRTG